MPRALARTEDALLMAFVGDGRDPAPQLRQVDAPIADVGRLWRDVLRTVVIGLDGNRVHGDLSPYNILMCAGRAIVIDWPQSVDPRANPSAEMLLHRDLAATVPWFVRRGMAIDAIALAGRLWSDWLRNDLDLDRIIEMFGNGSDPD